MFIFYYSKSSAAYAPHILLEEIGLEYKAVRIDFQTKEQRSPTYLKINPKGRVPALITEKGILTETPAMLAYLAQISPDQNLAPTDPFEFAIAQAFIGFMASTVHVAHAHKHRGSRWADDPLVHEAMRAKVTSNMTEYAQMILGCRFNYIMGQI